ncbi:hypothetical protein GQ43DRAFT_378080 [Delitschia confertaspora ATCC 74209]|uniref:Uncharacterized protein n=1 Tax=Delitschia confertaspora ATCC 74209 TaxID=1513339 RepID=A0A9P4MQ77_9PLEO|nr:hypothetical protein GQ43DRAFT_378080 [Delitschia confertaspora ATCC 74209]
MRFSITLGLCILLGLTLRAYEGFKAPRVLSRTQVKWFNAIVLGLSLALGLNLASSLKRYATILRWSILTKRYVSLEVFDLILGCETLTKVGKLMVISLPGIRKFPILRRLPWFRDARRDGDRITWIFCTVWLLINIGAQVLVASLSLFWPVDPSNAMPLLTYGTVAVADLSTWVHDTSIVSNASQLSVANTYGIAASEFPVFSVSDEDKTISPEKRNAIHKGDTYYEYRFLNRDPDLPYTNYYISSRSVRSNTTCIQLTTEPNLYKLNGKIYANSTLDHKTWDLYPVPTYSNGSITWVGSRLAYCGSRCTNLTVYQTHDEDEIKYPSLFLCNSTLSTITGSEKDFTYLKPADQAPLHSTDEFARIAAGAIAWTGYTENKRRERQSRMYMEGLRWGPYKMIQQNEVEDLISRFTIGAIAALDDRGPRYNIQDQRTKPVQGQQLNADWNYVLGILGGICMIQFGALIALIAFANKSIVRDESFFSLAMLLTPVVERIGKVGMNLSGDEIKRHPALAWKRIRYDYREGRNGEPNQVDIFFQGKDPTEARRSWASGVYT